MKNPVKLSIGIGIGITARPAQHNNQTRETWCLLSPIAIAIAKNDIVDKA